MNIITEILNNTFPSFLTYLFYRIKHCVIWTFYGGGNTIFTLVIGVARSIWKLVIAIQFPLHDGRRPIPKKSLGSAYICVHFPLYGKLCTPHILSPLQESKAIVLPPLQIIYLGVNPTSGTM